MAVGIIYLLQPVHIAGNHNDIFFLVFLYQFVYILKVASAVIKPCKRIYRLRPKQFFVCLFQQIFRAEIFKCLLNRAYKPLHIIEIARSRKKIVCYRRIVSCRLLLKVNRQEYNGVVSFKHRSKLWEHCIGFVF